jgi:hypothetical protein
VKPPKKRVRFEEGMNMAYIRPRECESDSVFDVFDLLASCIAVPICRMFRGKSVSDVFCVASILQRMIRMKTILLAWKVSLFKLSTEYMLMA